MAVVNVKFFGDVRNFSTEPGTVIELNDGATVMDLLSKLEKKYGQPFRENVLSDSSELYGIKGHVKLFMNSDVVESRNFSTTKVVADGVVAEATIYVVSATTGG